MSLYTAFCICSPVAQAFAPAVAVRETVTLRPLQRLAEKNAQQSVRPSTLCTASIA